MIDLHRSIIRGTHFKLWDYPVHCISNKPEIQWDSVSQPSADAEVLLAEALTKENKILKSH